MFYSMPMFEFLIFYMIETQFKIVSDLVMWKRQQQSLKPLESSHTEFKAKVIVKKNRGLGWGVVLIP